MTDQELKEAAALLPLDLLPEPERDELEAALAERPALRTWARDLHETAAAALLADCPSRRAPQGVLAEIHRRTAARARRCFVVRAVSLWGGWAAAAAVTILFYIDRASRPADSASSSGGVAAGKAGASTGNPPVGGNSPGVSTNPVGAEPVPEGNVAPGGTRGKDGLKERSREMVVSENEHLRRSMQQLMAAEAGRFMDRPGQVRVVFSELNAPGSKITPARRLTPERLGEIIAAEMTGASAAPGEDTPPDPSEPMEPEKKPAMVRPGDAWNNEIIIESGMPDFGVLNLPPNVTLKHADLPLADPVYSPRFTELPDQPGFYYDSISDVIWQPDVEGGYSGRRPGAEFNRDSLAGAAAPPPEAPVAAEPAPAPADTADPAAWTVFDETTGRGSLIYDGLPPAPDGMTYRLTFDDSRQGRAVDAAVFQSTSSGRISFDLGTAGYTPSGYVLSLGPVDRSSGSAPRIILSGPGRL